MAPPAPAASTIRVGGVAPPADAIRKKAANAVSATPEARPSSPSMRLTALMTATSQATVSGSAHAPSDTLPHGPSSRSIDRPSPKATSATTTWPESFTRARMPCRSSSTPMAAISAAPTRIAGKWPVSRLSGEPAARATTRAAAMPR
jgi:hypothetical protein